MIFNLTPGESFGDSSRQTTILEDNRQSATSLTALDKLEAGFCQTSDLTPSRVRFVLETCHEASIIRIGSAGCRGQRRYSIYDLIGHSIKGMVFLVIDSKRFAECISKQLEADFLAKNPQPESRLKCSFTSFMHDNNLHWSRCCGKGSVPRNSKIKEKLDKLSARTGKTRSQILSELLDSALKAGDS